MTAKYQPRPGDRVEHRRYPSYGVGTYVKHIVNPHFPSLPTGRGRVQFGHLTRDCVDADLRGAGVISFGEHRTRLVADGGDLVA